MNPNAWLEKAARLHGELARIRGAQTRSEHAPDEPETLERLTIAQWLRREFSDEPPEDTATLSLFECS